ncbi:MAG: hypothetical protein LBN30_00790 [Oscillospiraceae bacterium]|jgi:hypothetical protein|nr:hypothetical protein [Oscillospiraceae bacterium]
MQDNNPLGALFDNPQAAKLLEKKSALESLANSDDGKAIRQKLDGTSIAKAFDEGDMTTVSGAISGILSTPEGARLAETLRELMK